MAKTKVHKDLSVIIVNYKSWKHLENCLDSLHFSSQKISLEVIVVDNQSNDGNLTEFEKKYDWVRFLENSGNNGFANANNFGAQHANSDYFLFLNPDTIANQEAFEKMWEFAKKHHQVGIISCMQKKPRGGYEKSDRRFPNLFTLFGLTRAFSKIVSSNKAGYTEKEVLYTDWVSGSLVLMSKEWFAQIQGWNEDYWMYYEDMDLSKRVHDANGKIAVLQNSEIIHNHGGASRINMKTASLTKTEVQISKHVYVSHHFVGLERILALLILVIYNLISKFVLAIFGILLFFIPKMRLNVYLWTKILGYYFRSLKRGSWLSSNSMNLKKA